MVSYAMGTIGAGALWVAFAATIGAIVLLIAGNLKVGKLPEKRVELEIGHDGSIVHIIAAVALVQSLAEVLYPLLYPVQIIHIQ